jgi:hypothetical protein
VTTYYHVAGPEWRPGEGLYSFEQLLQRGEADLADWKWEERPYGDGSESWIFLYAHLGEALEHAADWGGTVLRVDDPEGVERDPVEGHPYVHGPIPAAWVAVVETLTLAEAATVMDLSPDSLRRRCRARVIPGAELKGKTWVIPLAALPTIHRANPGPKPMSQKATATR